MNDKYIRKETIEKLNNFELLIFTTEHYRQFMQFLKDERKYNEFKIKIGNFKYDDWEADIYCIMNKNGIFFKHIRKYDNREWTNKSLTEQLIYAWGFQEINFNLKFDTINNLWKMLTEEEKDYYDSLYDEAHSFYW